MACKTIRKNLYANHGSRTRSSKNAIYLFYKEKYGGTDFLIIA